MHLTVKRALAGIVVLVAVLAAVAGGLVVHEYRVPAGQVQRQVPAASQVLHGALWADPDVLWVGDSYIMGAQGVGRTATYPNRVCRKLRWSCVFDAQSGTGYTTRGTVNPSFRPYPTRLAEDVRRFPDVRTVIITGGRNDAADPEGEVDVARTYLQRVRAAWPAARLVVVEPFWSGPETAGIRTVREAARAAAAAVGATWVSTDGWLPPELLGRDRVHLTAEGHQELAEELEPQLAGLQ